MILYWFICWVFVFGFFPQGSIASENNCASCHSKIIESDVSRPEHSFKDWQGSIHAKRHINCDACHGGDASAKDASSAHKGIARSTDPESRIYFNKIPDTCGACHAKELKGFKDSAHYKELNNSGKGPNCVTCHGSMASHVMEPRELESVCTLCHRRPTKAYASLLTLKSVQKSIGLLRDELKACKEKQMDVVVQSNALARAEQSYRDILKVWHSFDMEKVLPMAQELNHSLRNTFHELDLKKKSKGGESK